MDLDHGIFPTSSHKTAELNVSGEVFGSKTSRNSRSSYVRAFWTLKDGKLATFDEMGLTPRAGVILDFLRHSFILNDETFTHWLARVEWFLPLPDDIAFRYGKPVECWQAYGRENMGPASFIPVCRLLDKCVHCYRRIRGRDTLVIVPRIKNSNF